MKNSFSSRVRYSETDECGKLSLFHMIAYMQDSCVFHGEDAGAGIEFQAAQKTAWVLANWQIHIEKYPKMGEAIEVLTWPYDFKKFMGYRNFMICDAAGDVIAKANSEWVYLNMETGKPVSIPEDLAHAYGWPPEEKLQDDFGGRKVRLPKEGAALEALPVMEHHLDTNHHMNNAKYLQMAESCMPQHEPFAKIRMEFKQQAHLGDLLYPVVSEVENGYVVSLNDENGKQYFVCEALHNEVE